MSKTTKLIIVYSEAAVFGIFAGIGVASVFGLLGVLVIIPMAVLHIWSAVLAISIKGD